MKTRAVATCGGIALLAIGVGAVVAPAASSGHYGLLTNDGAGLAFVRATGARDIALGLATLAFAAAPETTALRTIVAIGVAVALADAAIVTVHASPARPARRTVHLLGAALLTAAFLLTPTDDR